MSPRIKRLRKVINPPSIKGYNPVYSTEKQDTEKQEAVFICFEEYEALRLCDYDMFTHLEASKLMGVSRPTFTRIYASLRQKLATAFVDGRQIIIEGGKVYFDSNWYHCHQCTCYFNNPDKEKEIQSCPLCNNSAIERFDETVFENISNKSSGICYCPNCQFEKQHQLGIPCNENICPECKLPLRRKKVL